MFVRGFQLSWDGTSALAGRACLLLNSVTRKATKGTQTMKTKILVFIDWDRGVWAVQYRDNSEMVTEMTGFPASTPSIVVCDAIRKAKPESRIFAKIR